MTRTTIRHWAYAHPTSARYVLALLLILSGLAGFSLGFWVIGTGWYEAGWPLWLSLGALAALFLFRWKWKGIAPNKRAWRGYHMACVVILALLSVHLGSRFPVKYGPGRTGSEFLPGLHAATAAAAPAVPETGMEQPSAFQRFLQKTRQRTQNMPPWIRVLLTVLIVAFVVTLAIFTPYFACLLSCKDLAFLAVMVTIIGWLASPLGAVLWINHLWRRSTWDKERRRRGKVENSKGQKATKD